MNSSNAGGVVLTTLHQANRLTFGRTASRLVRSHSVFFRKLVVLMLLGFYGIPAALGPHWHHHGCSGHACVSHQLPVSSSVDSVHSHCTCQHHAVANKSTEQKVKPQTVSEQCVSLDGPCAICAFYASAQEVPIAFEFTGQARLISSIELLDAFAPCTLTTAAQARGPPVA